MSATHRRMKPRLNHGRTTTGCLCCRLRRKKCDENRPVCNGCDRNRLICTWPQKTLNENVKSAYGWKIRLSQGGEAPELDEGVINLTTDDGFSQKYQSSDRAPPRPLRVPQRELIAKHPNSSLLFEHYQIETARHLPVAMWTNNPFITYVLPLAYSSDLIMHGVLALSGAHLCFASTSAVITTATWTHYALALRGTKHALIRKINGESVNTLHLLLVTLLLCQVERISGNLDGAVFHHLRAARAIILLELQKTGQLADKELKGFLLELYAYLALVGNITIKSEQRSISLDPFLFSLDGLAEFETFGCMFGCASKLFEIIPSICILGRHRASHAEQVHYNTVYAEFQAIQLRIQDWEPPAIFRDESECNRQLVIAARIYQQGLMIFLHASFYVKQTDDSNSHAAQADLAIERCSDRMFELIDEISRKAASTILWPMIIMGSCLRLPAKQQKLRAIWARYTFQMTSVSRAIQLLNWLWDDPAAFGPHGLDTVMKKHKVNFCMA